MTKAYEFNWCRSVPSELLNGNTFDVWEEVFIGSKVINFQKQIPIY